MKDLMTIGAVVVAVLGAIAAQTAIITFSIFLFWNWMPANANRQITLLDALCAASLLSTAGSCLRSGAGSKS